jgi:hypothetical protein
MLIVFAGLPGTGKTTVSRAVAGELDAMYLRVDTIEQAIIGVFPTIDIGPSGYVVANAIAEANLLGPLECVVSIGTGIETRAPHPSAHRGLLGWTWAAIKRSVDPETPEMLARGILPPSKYIRFDPPSVGDCSTWEGDLTILRSCQKMVQLYMHEQRDVLAALIPRLCSEKPAVQDNEDRSVSNGSGSGCPVSG